MDQQVGELSVTGIDRAAKQVGDRAPVIRLRDQHGATFDVGTLLAKGPVVVTFYRGGWCPFCNLELKAYQAVLPRIAAAGASLVAISPEKPADSISTTEKNPLTLPRLTERRHEVGHAFRLVQHVPHDQRSLHKRF